MEPRPFLGLVPRFVQVADGAEAAGEALAPAQGARPLTFCNWCVETDRLAGASSFSASDPRFVSLGEPGGSERPWVRDHLACIRLHMLLRRDIAGEGIRTLDIQLGKLLRNSHKILQKLALYLSTGAG